MLWYVVSTGSVLYCPFWALFWLTSEKAHTNSGTFESPANFVAKYDEFQTWEPEEGSLRLARPQVAAQSDVGWQHPSLLRCQKTHIDKLSGLSRSFGTSSKALKSPRYSWRYDAWMTLTSNTLFSWGKGGSQANNPDPERRCLWHWFRNRRRLPIIELIYAVDKARQPWNLRVPKFIWRGISVRLGSISDCFGYFISLMVSLGNKERLLFPAAGSIQQMVCERDLLQNSLQIFKRDIKITTELQ